jgi:hypothetical protein
VSTTTQILNELLVREPLFHRRNIVSCEQDFLRETTEDFWEVGASGAIYDRATVLSVLNERWKSSEVDEADIDRWTTKDHRVQSISDDTFLLAYTLHGQGRTTRRTTIWQRSPDQHWRAIFHQGTVVQKPGEDVGPKGTRPK